MAGAIVRRSKSDDSLTDRQSEVLQFIEDHPGCTNADIAQAFRMSAKTSKVHLLALVRNGCVAAYRPHGMGRVAFWYTASALGRPIGLAERAAAQCSSVWDYARRMAAC